MNSTKVILIQAKKTDDLRKLITKIVKNRAIVTNSLNKTKKLIKDGKISKVIIFTIAWDIGGDFKNALIAYKGIKEISKKIKVIVASGWDFGGAIPAKDFIELPGKKSFNVVVEEFVS